MIFKFSSSINNYGNNFIGNTGALELGNSFTLLPKTFTSIKINFWYFNFLFFDILTNFFFINFFFNFYK